MRASGVHAQKKRTSEQHVNEMLNRQDFKADANKYTFVIANKCSVL